MEFLAFKEVEKYHRLRSDKYILCGVVQSKGFGVLRYVETI
jgi:hypothetical protein